MSAVGDLATQPTESLDAAPVSERPQTVSGMPPSSSPAPASAPAGVAPAGSPSSGYGMFSADPSPFFPYSAGSSAAVGGTVSARGSGRFGTPSGDVWSSLAPGSGPLAPGSPPPQATAGTNLALPTGSAALPSLLRTYSPALSAAPSSAPPPSATSSAAATATGAHLHAGLGHSSGHNNAMGAFHVQSHGHSLGQSHNHGGFNHVGSFGMRSGLGASQGLVPFPGSSDLGLDIGLAGGYGGTRSHISAFGSGMDVSASAMARKPAVQPNANLYIRNLPPHWTVRDLTAIFAPFGTPASVHIMTDHTTGMSKGVGFVRYTNLAAANLAIARLHRSTPADCLKPLVVKYADRTDRPPRTAGSATGALTPHGDSVVAIESVGSPLIDVAGSVGNSSAANWGSSHAASPMVRPASAASSSEAAAQRSMILTAVEAVASTLGPIAAPVFRQLLAPVMSDPAANIDTIRTQITLAAAAAAASAASQQRQQQQQNQQQQLLLLQQIVQQQHAAQGGEANATSEATSLAMALAAMQLASSTGSSSSAASPSASSSATVSERSAPVHAPSAAVNAASVGTAMESPSVSAFPDHCGDMAASTAALATAPAPAASAASASNGASSGVLAALSVRGAPPALSCSSQNVPQAGHALSSRAAAALASAQHRRGVSMPADAGTPLFGPKGSRSVRAGNVAGTDGGADVEALSEEEGIPKRATSIVPASPASASPEATEIPAAGAGATSGNAPGKAAGNPNDADDNDDDGFGSDDDVMGPISARTGPGLGLSTAGMVLTNNMSGSQSVSNVTLAIPSPRPNSAGLHSALSANSATASNVTHNITGDFADEPDAEAGAALRDAALSPVSATSAAALRRAVSTDLHSGSSEASLRAPAVINGSIGSDTATAVIAAAAAAAAAASAMTSHGGSNLSPNSIPADPIASAAQLLQALQAAAATNPSGNSSDGPLHSSTSASNVYGLRDFSVTPGYAASYAVVGPGLVAACGGVGERFSSTNIYVGGFGEQATENDLRQMFGVFGAISSIKVMVDEATGRGKGVGLVRFTAADSASAAVAAMNGALAPSQALGGVRPLQVRHARVGVARARAIAKATAAAATEAAVMGQYMNHYNQPDTFDSSLNGYNFRSQSPHHPHRQQQSSVQFAHNPAMAPNDSMPGLQHLVKQGSSSNHAPDLQQQQQKQQQELNSFYSTTFVPPQPTGSPDGSSSYNNYAHPVGSQMSGIDIAANSGFSSSAFTDFYSMPSHRSLSASNAQEEGGISGGFGLSQAFSSLGAKDASSPSGDYVRQGSSSPSLGNDTA